MSSYLDFEGVYNPSLRFAVTNITDEDLKSAWDGNPIIVKSRQTVELPQHLAYKLTGELVDKIMQGGTTIGGQRTQHEGVKLGVPASRKVWEDKVLRQLAVDEESPEIVAMRAQIKNELIRDMSNLNEPEKTGISDVSVKEPKKRGRPVRVKVIEEPFSEANEAPKP